MGQQASRTPEQRGPGSPPDQSGRPRQPRPRHPGSPAGQSEVAACQPHTRAGRSWRAPRGQRLLAPLPSLPLGANPAVGGRGVRQSLKAVGLQWCRLETEKEAAAGRSGSGGRTKKGAGRGKRARGGEREVWSGWAVQAPLPGCLLGGGASCWVPRRGGQGVCAAHGVPREACAQEAAGLPSPVPRPGPGPR